MQKLLLRLLNCFSCCKNGKVTVIFVFWTTLVFDKFSSLVQFQCYLKILLSINVEINIIWRYTNLGLFWPLFPLSHTLKASHCWGKPPPHCCITSFMNGPSLKSTVAHKKGAYFHKSQNSAILMFNQMENQSCKSSLS